MIAVGERRSPRQKPEGRDAAGTTSTSILACCTRREAEDWYADILEAAQVDEDMAALLPRVEEHLRRAGGIAEPPWWAR
jgi:hypothetical protein